MFTRIAPPVISLVACLAFALLLQSAPAAEPAKLAFVVGVAKYQKDGLKDLQFAEDDARELGAELKSKLGFKVASLLGERATKAGLERELGLFFADLKKLKKDDIVLLAFAGHGLQLMAANERGTLIETPFFCPHDALKTDPTTLLSLNWVMQHIVDDSASSQNLLIVDACRDNPARGSRGVDGSTVKELPSKLSVLFGSSAGTQSYESAQKKHGIFTYYLLEGLRGEAANRRGEITWLTLASHTMDAVKRNAPDLVGAPQSPNLLGNLISQPVLAKIVEAKAMTSVTPPAPATKPDSKPKEAAPLTKTDSKPSTPPPASPPAKPDYPQRPTSPPANPPKTESSGTVRITEGKKAGDLTADNSLGLKLIWCPSTRQPFVIDGRMNVTLRGFWIGKYELTQKEWKAVMGTTPWTDPALNDSLKSFGSQIIEGDDYPASNVGWADAMKFCDELTRKERAAGKLPAGWLYRLPTEAQWEYAGRAGKNARFDINAFAEDEKYAAEHAWQRGTGTPANESYAHRVGTKKPNEWGLHDMLGNVAEWCRDYNLGEIKGTDPEGTSTTEMHILRGDSYEKQAGFWNTNAGTDHKWATTGFRVALVQSAK